MGQKIIPYRSDSYSEYLFRKKDIEPTKTKEEPTASYKNSVAFMQMAIFWTGVIVVVLFACGVIRHYDKKNDTHRVNIFKNQILAMYKEKAMERCASEGCVMQDVVIVKNPAHSKRTKIYE